MRCPLIQKLPKSKASLPSLASSSAPPGSFGMNTPTTPMLPAAFTVCTKLFIVKLGTSLPCMLQHWYPCRREGRQRTFRRQNDGIESQLLESLLADLGCAVVGPEASVKQALAMTDAEAQPVQKKPTIQVSSRFIRQIRALWCRG